MESKTLDTYTLKAQLAPMAVVVIPVWLLVFAFAPGQLNAWQTALGAALPALGIPILLSQIGRDQGKKKEPTLFRKWGGAPTTRILRHRDTSLDGQTLQRYHAKLAFLVPNVTVPSAQSEGADNEAADRVYESLTRYLREKTRDHSAFSMVFQENMNYGFRRNLWGMKKAGIALALLGTGGCLAIAILRFMGQGSNWQVAGGLVLVNALLLSLWLLRFTPNWVKVAGDAYAERLLGATETM